MSFQQIFSVPSLKLKYQVPPSRDIRHKTTKKKDLNVMSKVTAW